MKDRTTWTVAAALVVTTSAFAAAVRIGYADRTRQVLGYSFAGVSARPETVIAILATNLRILAVAVGAAIVVQLPWCVRRTPVALVLVSALDALVALEATLNMFVIGAALGAYGSRMLLAVLPHGPFELAAFAIALSLYMRARQHALTLRQIAGATAACVGILTLAAVLETYAAP